MPSSSLLKVVMVNSLAHREGLEAPVCNNSHHKEVTYHTLNLKAGFLRLGVDLRVLSLCSSSLPGQVCLLLDLGDHRPDRLWGVSLVQILHGNPLKLHSWQAPRVCQLDLLSSLILVLLSSLLLVQLSSLIPGQLISLLLVQLFSLLLVQDYQHRVLLGMSCLQQLLCQMQWEGLVFRQVWKGVGGSIVAMFQFNFSQLKGLDFGGVGAHLT